MKKSISPFLAGVSKMTRIQRIALTILVLVLLGGIFRGGLYRSIVVYKTIGARTIYPITDVELWGYMDENMGERKGLTIEEVIGVSLAATTKALYFTAERNYNNPNLLLKSKKAHCVGYASFFATTCQYLLEKEGLSVDWEVKPHRGQLYVLGINIHSYLHTPFFKDHDFVTIEHKKTGKVFAIDPTVADYMGIDFISFRR